MTNFPLAPDLSPSLNWVNCPEQRIAALRGRVVLLAFWHAASAPSANLLADLAYLQLRYADGLSVIGIHTPKFDAQRDADLVARAVNRLGVRFPVASDADAVAWQHYGIRGWPSVAVIDARGRLVETVAGDQQRDALEGIIVRLLDQAGEAGWRVYENAQSVSRPEPLSEVAFPRGMALSSDRLYLADSGHHRILECTHDGRVLRAFGSGTAGFVDGLGVQARFQAPVGLALLKDMLFVSDTGNHAIRRIRLATGEVDTLIGRGQAGTPRAATDFRAADILLDHPHGVVASLDRLYLALSASNQIWELDLGRHSFRPLAGSGRLALADGSGALAGFAQPAGLALQQHTLYVSDGQASALRSLHLGTGEVQTLVGKGLFEYGLIDGGREEARLQYPQGIALDPAAPLLWVADSYNNAIRMLRLEQGELVQFPLEHGLRRPTALASNGEQLWISNTDAHEVLRVDLSSGQVQCLPMAP